MEFLGTGFFFLQMYFSGNEACKSWASLIFQGNKLFLDKIAVKLGSHNNFRAKGFEKNYIFLGNRLKEVFQKFPEDLMNGYYQFFLTESSLFGKIFNILGGE